MDLSIDEIVGKKETFTRSEVKILLVKFAEQEAKSYASWLSYQSLGRKTANQLWNEFQESLK